MLASGSHSQTNQPVAMAAARAARVDRVGRYLRVLRGLGLIRTEETTRASLEHLFRGVELEGCRVLDIGGGRGIQSFYAAAMGAAEVICLEPEVEGSARGMQRTFERIGASMPDLPVTLDARPVERFADAAGFDVIMLNSSINHIDEEACIRLLEEEGARASFRRVFAHIASLARPGARLIVVDCTRYNFFNALGLRNPIQRSIEWQKHQNPEVWAALLQEAGFRNPRVSWRPLFRFGKVGEAVTSNRVVSYFLKSAFRLLMTKG